MKVRAKVVFDAVQWYPGIPTAGVVREIGTGMYRMGKVSVRGGEIFIKPGDWLVDIGEVAPVVVTDVVFRLAFDPVTE